MNTLCSQAVAMFVRSAVVLSCMCMLGLPAHAQDKQPIRLAVLAPLSITPGKAIANGAELAARQINAAGGIDGRPIKLVVYDTQLSSVGAINAMKKAVLQDHAVGVAGVFTTEASLPLMPYAKRLDVPLILQSGSSEIGTMVHEHYDEYRNVFLLQINSYYLAQAGCDAAHDLFASSGGAKVSAVIMSEQADWTRPLDQAYEECLPKVGIKVDKVFKYAVNTSDFGPIYNQITRLKPNLIVVGMAHTGLTPVVQWHQRHVPSLMFGFSMQAGTSGFWKASNGAAQDNIIVPTGAGVAMTSKTPQFYDAYVKAYGEEPMLVAYTSYDAIDALADAMKKAGSTSTTAVVKELESLNMEGVTGRIRFYGRDARFTHSLKYGRDGTTGVAFQWQNGKQVVVWPKSLAQGPVQYPDFVRKP